jgi:hypothetical protein
MVAKPSIAERRRNKRYVSRPPSSGRNQATSPNASINALANLWPTGPTRFALPFRASYEINARVNSTVAVKVRIARTSCRLPSGAARSPEEVVSCALK